MYQQSKCLQQRLDSLLYQVSLVSSILELFEKVGGSSSWSLKSEDWTRINSCCWRK